MLIDVKSGVDNIAQIDGFLRGRRVGFTGGAASVDRLARPTLEILSEHYELTALFAPEHGIRGDAQAGAEIKTYVDPKLGVPVYSLYGDASPGGGNRPSREALRSIDVMVVDLQEAGVRFYTFLYTLAYIMEACAEAGVPVAVLDRVAPLGGDEEAGAICDPAFSSFVGNYELPARTGLTPGEYARYVNAYLNLGCELVVAPVTGWRRSAYFDETDLPWAPPSPNIPTVDSCFAYVGTCIFEGVNVSEGRGTTKPFELIGAPWLDTDALTERMARRGTPGALLRKTYFTPMFSKYAGELCAAVQIHVTDREICEPFRLGLTMLEEIWRRHPDKLSFISQFSANADAGSATYHFDRILGTDDFRKRRYDADTLINIHKPSMEAYKANKVKFHLYE